MGDLLKFSPEIEEMEKRRPFKDEDQLGAAAAFVYLGASALLSLACIALVVLWRGR